MVGVKLSNARVDAFGQLHALLVGTYELGARTVVLKADLPRLPIEELMDRGKNQLIPGPTRGVKLPTFQPPASAVALDGVPNRVWVVAELGYIQPI